MVLTPGTPKTFWQMIQVQFRTYYSHQLNNVTFTSTFDFLQIYVQRNRHILEMTVLQYRFAWNFGHFWILHHMENNLFSDELLGFNLNRDKHRGSLDFGGNISVKIEVFHDC